MQDCSLLIWKGHLANIFNDFSERDEFCSVNRIRQFENEGRILWDQMGEKQCHKFLFFGSKTPKFSGRVVPKWIVSLASELEIFFFLPNLALLQGKFRDTQTQSQTKKENQFAAGQIGQNFQQSTTDILEKNANESDIWHVDGLSWTRQNRLPWGEEFS